MSITITISAEDAEHARREMAALLGRYPQTEITVDHSAPRNTLAELPAPGVTDSLLQSVAGKADEAQNSQNSPEASAKRKPGRPRSAPPAEATASPAPVAGGETQPADAANPSSPPATETAASAGTSPTEAAETLSAADVKKLLQDVNAKIGGEEGLNAVAAILAEHGMMKVKELADHPEHFAAIAMKCRAKLAA